MNSRLKLRNPVRRRSSRATKMLREGERPPERFGLAFGIDQGRLACRKNLWWLPEASEPSASLDGSEAPVVTR
jgi:hypothetical protein